MATRKKTLKATSTKVVDRTTAYATDVVAGSIVAGPHVRAQCQRHLNDMAEGAERGLWFDVAEAERRINFFPDVLCLNGGEFEGVPFELFGWEQFIIGSLFGWKKEDGYRRFRVAYIETGKGSGKSPLVAGIGLMMQNADNEPRAEVYAAAVKKDQAAVLFRDAVAMVEYSPALFERLRIIGGSNPTNILNTSTGSFFKPISSEERGKGQSGPRPHCGILDEVHEHSTNAMIEFLRAGLKNRRQALICMITNSGSSRQSVCYDYHEYAVKIAAGELYDDGFFGYVCALDEGEDPFESEDCWPKANPSLPVIPGYTYLREQVREAKGLPSKEALVRRLNFCEWTDAENPLFSREVWMAVQHDLDIKDYDGKRCWLALDLSGKSDLTALTIVFESKTGIDVFTEYWTPADTLKERAIKDRAPYDKWVEQGFLTAVPGSSIRYEFVAKRIEELTLKYDVQLLAFDRVRIEDLENELDDLGLEHHRIEDEDGYGLVMVSHGQGFIGMAPAIDALEEQVLNNTVRIQANPVTNMCAANAVVTTDPADNRKFDKKKATGRIDGMVSMAMGIHAAVSSGELGDGSSIYESGKIFMVG